MTPTGWVRAVAAGAVLAVTLAGQVNASSDGEEPTAALELDLPEFGRVRVVTREDADASPPRGTLWLETPAGEAVYRFPDLPETGTFAFWRTADLAAADLDGDGREDVVVVVEYLTGIGAQGAEPFPLAAVYLQRARGFERSPALEKLANEAPLYGTWSGAEDLVAQLQAADR